MLCCKCKNTFYLKENIKNNDICEFCKHVKCNNCCEMDKIINYMHTYKNLSIDETNNNHQYNKKKYKCFQCFIL